jgi:hypothetical protein
MRQRGGAAVGIRVAEASSSMPTNGGGSGGSVPTAAVAALATIQQSQQRQNNNNMTTTQQPTQQPIKQPKWRRNRIEWQERNYVFFQCPGKSQPLDSATPARPPKVLIFGHERYVFMFLGKKMCLWTWP